MSKALSFPKEKIRFLLLEGIHENAVAHLKRAGYSRVERLGHALSGAELHEKIAQAHVIGVRSRTQLSGEVLA